MEHRKRSMMQQKVELSTLLRIVIASRGCARHQDNVSVSQNLTKILASEAMEYLKNCDICETSVKGKNTAIGSRLPSHHNPATKIPANENGN